jgi:hypothetical protein
MFLLMHLFHDNGRHTRKLSHAYMDCVEMHMPEKLLSPCLIPELG